MKVGKNKVSPPLRVVELDLLYGEGISREGSVLDGALDAGIVVRNGAWFNHGSDRLGQGRETVLAMLRANPDLLAELTAQVRAAHEPRPAHEGIAA